MDLKSLYQSLPPVQAKPGICRVCGVQMRFLTRRVCTLCAEMIEDIQSGEAKIYHQPVQSSYADIMQSVYDYLSRKPSTPVQIGRVFFADKPMQPGARSQCVIRLLTSMESAGYMLAEDNSGVLKSYGKRPNLETQTYSRLANCSAG